MTSNLTSYDLMILHLTSYNLVIFYQCIKPLLARSRSYGLSIQKGLHELGKSRWLHRRVLGDLCISPGPLLHLLH